jgi:hypothetical protein
VFHEALSKAIFLHCRGCSIGCHLCSRTDRGREAVSPPCRDVPAAIGLTEPCQRAAGDGAYGCASRWLTTRRKDAKARGVRINFQV